MTPVLTHIFMEEHLEDIRDLVHRQVEARVVLVASRHSLSNRLALSLWGDPEQPDRILISKTISVGEQISILTDLWAGRIGEDMAGKDMGRIFKTSRDILVFIVLHEVAHIKFNWGAALDRECSRWALDRVSAPDQGKELGDATAFSRTRG